MITIAIRLRSPRFRIVTRRPVSSRRRRVERCAQHPPGLVRAAVVVSQSVDRSTRDSRASGGPSTVASSVNARAVGTARHFNLEKIHF
jgi:negative regulator of sigma E activity